MLKECPALQENLKALSLAAKQLSMRLLKCISMSLDCEENFVGSIHVGMFEEGTDNATSLRSIYYPPIPDHLHKTESLITR